jgi:hypothetical protein
VKTQILIAVTVYVFVAIVKNQIKLNQNLYTMLQIRTIRLTKWNYSKGFGTLVK